MSEKFAQTTTFSSPSSFQDESLSLHEQDRAVERRILRKLDLRVVPVLWFLFLVSFVDRGNIANAKIQGMDKELHLTGNKYNTAVWVFTLAYVVFGVPANIVFRLTGPKSLSVMMFLWSLTVIGQGLTKSYAGLVVCRFLEGICEAGFVPGCAYLIGSYYKRDEFLRRYVIFFSAAIIAGAFNGVCHHKTLCLCSI
jgi:MFS family permease